MAWVGIVLSCLNSSHKEEEDAVEKTKKLNVCAGGVELT